MNVHLEGEQGRHLLFWLGGNYSGGHAENVAGTASLDGGSGVLLQKILKNRRSLLASERIFGQEGPIFLMLLEKGVLGAIF